MVTSDDEQTTDIVVEGDQEEVERLRKVSGGALRPADGVMV
jgi:hypothetical protein